MKRIVICGAGEVGKHAAEVLANEGHRVTLIDLDAEKLRAVEEDVDINALKGSSCHPGTLNAASVDEADALIAATNSDEVNLLTAALGKRMGAGTVIARIHDRSYFETASFSYSHEFGIDHLICPEQLTSTAISSNLADPGVIEIEHFANNQIEMHRYRIATDSSVVGPDLSQLSLPAGMRLAVVSRQGKAFVPDAETILQVGDIVTLVGRASHFKEVGQLFSKKKIKSNNRIVVMGGTTLAAWIVEDLNRLGFQIRWFEPDHAKATELAEKHPCATMIAADPTDPEQFRSEQIGKCRAFITVSDDDEHNILGALHAKQFGVPTTVSVVHSPTYLHLLATVGIDLPFSPRIVAAKELLKIIDNSPVKAIATLAPRVAHAYEVGPVQAGSAVGSKLKEVELPKGMFVAATQRGDDVLIPGGEDEIKQDDVLVVIGPPDMERRLTRLFIRS